MSSRWIRQPRAYSTSATSAGIRKRPFQNPRLSTRRGSGFGVSLTAWAQAASGTAPRGRRGAGAGGAGGAGAGGTAAVATTATGTAAGAGSALARALAGLRGLRGRADVSTSTSRAATVALARRVAVFFLPAADGAMTAGMNGSVGTAAVAALSAIRTARAGDTGRIGVSTGSAGALIRPARTIASWMASPTPSLVRSGRKPRRRSWRALLAEARRMGRPSFA